mmetsp:Transcript_88481/g.129400  ORF Transcript_88481/g.129400 Transcript_88481/m.129400 type:complete len:144 (+) Transcript_88481:111-542(+)
MQGTRMCLEAADFVWDTSLGCMVVQSFLGSRRATVTAENRSGSVIHAWSIDVPDLSVIQVNNQQATGLVWVTIMTGLGVIERDATAEPSRSHSGSDDRRRVVGVGVWISGLAGPRRRNLQAGTDAGGVTGGVWGVASAHGGLW